MPILVDDPRLEKMEKLVEACHPSQRRKNPESADFGAAQAEVEKMGLETGHSEEWYHLSSRFARYKLGM